MIYNRCQGSYKMILYSVKKEILSLNTIGPIITDKHTHGLTYERTAKACHSNYCPEKDFII